MTGSDTKNNLNPTLPLLIVSFFAADVQAGVGPFLGIYLQAQGWTPDTIGTVLTIGGIVSVLVTTPAGALVDATSHRRSVIAGASALTVVAAGIVLFAHGFWAVTLSQIATAVGGATMGPALAGLTLGIVGRHNFDRQFGRNQVANHAGNLVAAVVSGCFGMWFGIPYIFGMSALVGVACIVSAYCIPGPSVHPAVARGMIKKAPDDTSDSRADSMRILLRNRPLLVLAVALAMFNLGNSAMLPLYSLSVSSTHRADASQITAANIVISQIVMLIAAACASRATRRWGFWWIILVTLVTLPLRAIAAAWIGSTWGILPVQIFDGIGAGLQSVVVPSLVVHLLHGSGRVNLGQGAVQAVQAAGACMSPLLGGWLAQHYGYSFAFIVLGALSLVSLAIWVGFGRQARQIFDTRHDELAKLGDVDSSALLR